MLSLNVFSVVNPLFALEGCFNRRYRDGTIPVTGGFLMIFSAVRSRLAKRPAYPHPSYPLLTERNLEVARLFPSRNELIASLGCINGTIAEVGVALGDFTEILIDKLKPKLFVAFDNFEMDNWADIWGVSKEKTFHGLSHIEFYRQRFRDVPQVKIEAGDSRETLSRLTDQSFDLIYIDANHTYEAVKSDIEIAKHKIKRDGILMFNDYMMYDHNGHFPYGVVQAVNELVVAEDWRVIGLGLNPHMYCDIAIRRASS